MNKTYLQRRQQGFSLIEILVVLVIMGLMVSIIAPTVLGRADDARIQKVHADFSAIGTALKLYRLDNYAWPTTEQGLMALVEKPVLEPLPQQWKSGAYVEALPLDPWNRPYVYLTPGQHGDFDVYTLGADGLPGGEGQNADIGNWHNNTLAQ